MWRAIEVASLGLMMSLAACGSAEHDTARDSAADPDPEGAARSRIGVVFDPLVLRAGDTVAGLVVTRADVQRAAIDSTPVGVVAFRGELQVTGRLVRHFDADAAARAVCFEADSGSAARLPRWAGDRRRSWFCFTNPGDARKALPAADSGVVSIAVDDFVINRGLSDQVNAARFQRRISPAPRPSR